LDSQQSAQFRMNKLPLKLIATAAWFVIFAIAYATLARVNFVYDIYYKLAPLVMRPEMSTYAHFVHVLAFLLLGALFSVAYPRRTLLVCALVFGAAILLEILQTITPDRHGTIIDAAEKMIGGGIGILLSKAIAWCSDRRMG
jgi:VanZ family protein